MKMRETWYEGNGTSNRQGEPVIATLYLLPLFKYDSTWKTLWLWKYLFIIVCLLEKQNCEIWKHWWWYTLIQYSARGVINQKIYTTQWWEWFFFCNSVTFSVSILIWLLLNNNLIESIWIIPDEFCTTIYF